MGRRVGNGKHEEHAAREAIMESMLLCTGEIGYREVSVERLRLRSGVDSEQFDRYFEGKAACFATSYAWKADRLADKLVALIEEEGESRPKTRRVLEAIAAFANQQEGLARALVVEGRKAGKEPLSKRREVMKRLSDAVEQAWPQTRSPHSSVATTAEFLVSAVDQALATALLVGTSRNFSRAIPELVELIQPYLDRRNERALDPADGRG